MFQVSHRLLSYCDLCNWIRTGGESVSKRGPGERERGLEKHT